MLSRFEAAWRGDIKTIKKLCNGTGTYKHPLQIAVVDSWGFSVFYIAMIRGHIQAAKEIFRIAEAQYTPKDSGEKKHYHVDTEGPDSETSDGDSELAIMEEVVHEFSTIDHVGMTSEDRFKCEISPIVSCTNNLCYYCLSIR